jgi:hypothetical protein
MLVLVALASGSCNLIPDRALEDLERAINVLETQSKAWQDVLRELESKLKRDADDLLQHQVTNLVQRSAAAAATNVQCVVDATKGRITESLRNLVRVRKKLTPVATIPYVCSVVPSPIDLRVPRNTMASVDFFGFDMDLSQPTAIEVWLTDDHDAKQENVSRWLQVPSHYHMQLNVSPGGVPFKPTSHSLVLKWNGREVSSVNIAHNKPPVGVQVFYSMRTAAQYGGVAAAVLDGFTLIGGGCRSNSVGPGQLLTGSYPDGEVWLCEAQAHSVEDTSTLTAYAIGVPTALKLDMKQWTASSQGPPTDRPSATATIGVAGYEVIGGGCRSDGVYPKPGNNLVRSYPTTNAWVCESTAHNSVSSPSTITAWVIGARQTQALEIVRGPEATSGVLTGVRNNQAAVLPENSDAQVIGGGCQVDFTGPGNLLFAAYPELSTGLWTCGSKDHKNPSPGKVTAVSFGLKYR